MRNRFSDLACATFVIILLAMPRPMRAAEKRLLTLDDFDAIREVESPRLSPDGEWVAYTVTTIDLKKDKSATNIWMTRWNGSENAALTHGDENQHDPRWSADGKFLAFLSSRGGEDDAPDQLWILNRGGGEAEKITDFQGGVSDYDWSPDGRSIVVAAEDPDPNEPGKDKGEKKTPPPIVIDRFYFKEDVTGYLVHRHAHLYLLDVVSRKSQPLTSGDRDELLPAYSPDSSRIAFVTKHAPDPDRTDNWDIDVIEARAGAAAQRVTTSDRADDEPDWESRPAWSPDGKSIAYLEGADPKLIEYGVHQLAVISALGGERRLLAPDLDRNVEKPRWSIDGKTILFVLEDDRCQKLARISAQGGSVEILAGGESTVSDFDLSRDGRVVALASSPHAPSEVSAAEKGKLRPLSRQNDALLSQLKLGAQEETSFKSKDGTEVHGFLVKPPDFQPGRRYPAILRIHGGPAWQFSREFQFDWQLFAAHGYVVVAANPRGSTGRGVDYCKAIYASWGEKDVEDVLGAVDDAVARGIADPNRLGVGGHSYGGMLTNYTIARDSRFKAATSGAGISNILAGYGTDEYVRDYETELGRPWERPENWIRVSYPFFHADRISTPTLFEGGSSDFNVPLLGTEQMYQALRSLGRDTELVIYPGQFHGLTKPTYQRDRLERFVAWYGRFLVGTQARSAAAP